MKNFIVEDTEKKSILQMHKSLMKEQVTQRATGELSPDLKVLRQAMAAGCLKNGSLKTKKSTGEYFYRKPSAKEPGKEVDFFANMTYKFSDGSKSGKWVCPEIATQAAAAATAAATAAQTSADNESKIETLKKQGYKTLDELRKENVDLTTLDKVYKKVTIGNVDLYISAGTTNFTPNTSTAEFNQDQLSFISQFEKKGYKLNPTRLEQSALVKVTDKELGAPTDLFPNGLVMWYNPNAQSQISGREGSVLSDILSNQSIDRQACRKNVKDYFETFKRKNSIVIDPATINKAKRIVQACKDEHYGQWGIAGGGNRLDSYLDILSGNKEGGPTSYGDDSIWRIK
jgi:alkaline phosphatase